jgi:hypothetical protein
VKIDERADVLAFLVRVLGIALPPGFGTAPAPAVTGPARSG